MQAYDKYKDSGIEWLGEIPEHWEVRKLKTALKINNGLDYKHVQSDEGYPVIGSGGQFAYASEFLYEGEVILLGRKGSIDKPLYFNGRFWAVDTMFYCVPYETVNARFLLYCAITIPFNYYSTSTALPSMTQFDLNNHRLAFPPLHEQEAIATFLDDKCGKIDEAVRIKQQQIEKLKELRQITIHNAVTKGINPEAEMKDSGIDWIGEIPKHWEVKRLKYVFRILKRIANELGHEVLSITQKGIRVKDITTGEGQLAMDYSKYQLAYKGDFAMNHMDLLTGWADVSEYNGVISPDYRVFELINKTNIPVYFLHLLQDCYRNKTFYAHGQGVSMLGRWRFPTENFNNFSFPIPPITEQKQIVSYLDAQTSKIDKASALKTEQITKLNEYKKSLINDVVTGKIKVA
jgi:Restriction endonuclease S subunits